MDSIAATIGERGEVQLPAQVLSELGLRPHDPVEVTVADGAVHITPATVVASTEAKTARSERAARRRAALAPIARVFDHETVEEAEQAVAAARAEVRAEARQSHRGPSSTPSDG